MTTNSTPKKILWVEDDKLLGKILGDAIARDGFILKTALSGREAIDLLKDFVPDVLMVDLYLPGDMNGYDILERFKNDPRFRGIPTIILSNFGRSESFGREHPIEPTRYLMKADVSVAKIVETLKSVLGQ